jgi:hypothetical protein
MGCVCAFAFGFSARIHGTSIDVFQGGNYKGTIQAYSGTDPAAVNYDYFSHSGHPTEGPNLRYNRGELFFYDGAEGTTFNVIFNKEREPGDPPTSGLVSWNLFTANNGDLSVILSDDKNELKQPYPNVFKGRWEWRNNTDGGIIGPFTPDWALLIDPKEYDRLDALRVFSADGKRFNLNLHTGPRGTMLFVLSGTIPVPETGSTLLLGALGFITVASAAQSRKLCRCR